MLISIS